MNRSQLVNNTDYSLLITEVKKSALEAKKNINKTNVIIRIILKTKIIKNTHDSTNGSYLIFVNNAVPQKNNFNTNFILMCPNVN